VLQFKTLTGVVFKMHFLLGEDLDLGYSGQQDPIEDEQQRHFGPAWVYLEF
jgi:hypothetical protein